MSRLILSRLGWTLWALVPVVLIAYHFGPGQAADREEQAARAVADARALEQDARRAQEVAYAAHLEAIAARAAAFGRPDPELRATALAAGGREETTARDAAAAWTKVAASLATAQSLLEGAGASEGGEGADGGPLAPLVDASALREVRLAHARALVRSGEVAAGAESLEDLLLELDERDAGDAALALAAREELATAYYYGARLLRLAGAPAEEWRKVAVLSRQNFRYLAEELEERGAGADRVRELELNTELVLNLEQSSLEELQAKARPRESPTGECRGLGKEPRPGRRGNRQGEQPNRGASMNGEIGIGW